MSKHSWPEDEPLPTAAEPTSTAEEPTAVEPDVERADVDPADESDVERADAVEDPADAVDSADGPAVADTAADAQAAPAEPKRSIDWRRVLAYGVLPVLALLLAAAAGYLKWQDNSIRNAHAAGEDAVQSAKDITTAMLTYRPDTVEQQLGEARKNLTGEFLDTYSAVSDNVIIPGAKEQQISAVASVPAAAPVSSEPDRAVVLLFVNQTVAVAQNPPTDNTMRVRATMEKSGDRWLISKFEPV